MERIKRRSKDRNWRKVITYFLTCCLFLNTSLPVILADAVPGMIEGEIFVQGTGGFDTVGNTTTITTGGPSTIIEYTRFNIDALRTVDFAQPDASSAVLNRVIEANQSLINGDLLSNGRVFLVNPAGIIFESGSTVNVTQLVASGLGMTNKAFKDLIDDPVNNKMEFLDGDGGVINRAKITANSVYLIGKKVWNNSQILAKDGLVVMAAGDEVRLFQDGSDVSVVVNSEGDGFYYPDITNTSNVDALNGKIVLAAGDTFSRAIYVASNLIAQNGTVTVQAALVKTTGRIDVSPYPADADGDGGSISLTGVDEVIISPSIHDNPGRLCANAGLNGNGGDITIQTEGKLTIEENSLITATGGSVSGNGGSVTITCDDFEIAGDIDASFGNELSENELGDPGKLVINSPSVIIADIDDPYEMDTLYENDIEDLSKAGTSLIVNAEEGITVKDIKDGEITGQYGSIELHATGENSAVTFDDTTNTIRTSLGDIIIEAGGGGIMSGNLITAKDSHPRSKPFAGKIMLTTNNGGDIETKDLTIESGWGTAEIDVKASGNLTVNGDVIVGQQGDGIQNVPYIKEVQDAENAHAIVKLSAGDDLELNGFVGAYAYGEDDNVAKNDKTLAEITITGNTNLNPTGGNVNIYGNLEAVAQASTEGTSEAIIEVDALVNGDIDLHGFTAHAKADQADVQGTESDEKWSEDVPPDHAQIIIHIPELEAYDDEYLGNHMGQIITADDSVLINDFDPEGDPLDLTAELVTDVEHGTLTLNEDGTYTYEPEAGFVGTDSFWYTATDGENVSNPAEVTIELTNELPFANDVGPTETYMNYPVTGDFDYADTPDGEGGPTDFVTVKLVGAIGDVLTTARGGTVTITKSDDIYTFTYTPPEGYVGSDSFEYMVTDAEGVIDEEFGQATVTIMVSEKPIITVPSYMPPAPGLERMRIEVQTSGCPALVKWAAEEIGIDQRMVQIWISNSLASTGNIQPCDACEGLKNSAQILQDADGSHIAALTQVIGEFASSNTPPTEEQMASIADAIVRNTDEDSYYAVAGEYLDALATYIGVLNNDMGFSTVESVQFVTDKYVGRFTQGDNVGVATFIAANLAALGE